MWSIIAAWLVVGILCGVADYAGKFTLLLPMFLATAVLVALVINLKNRTQVISWHASSMNTTVSRFDVSEKRIHGWDSRFGSEPIDGEKTHEIAKAVRSASSTYHQSMPLR